MSDGPHKSLPLARPWKEGAKRAANPAHSISEVCEALIPALLRDLSGPRLAEIRDILAIGHQRSLFAEDTIAQLNEARRGCVGMAVENAMLDGVIAAVSSGFYGDEAMRRGLEHAAASTLDSKARSIEEHYLREAGDRQATFIRGRLEAARDQCDFSAIAAKLASPSPVARESLAIPRHAGLDDGPPL